MKKSEVRWGLFGLSILVLTIIATYKKPVTTEEKIAAAKEQYVSDSTARENVDAQIKTRLLERLNEAESYVRTFDLADREGVSAITYVTTCKLLDDYGATAKGYANDEDADIKKRALKLQKELKALRIKAMPVLRKRWAKAMGETLWENDVTVKCFGKGNKTIEFVGGMFAANANIKDSQDAASDALYLLRFTRANYKWYSGDDEYTYYTMKSLGDGEL
jgi:hypothetical protein